MQNRADKRRYHYIYKITRDDGKYYIGMHSTDDLDDGYFGSGTKIVRSVKRHGKNKHKKQILKMCASRHDLRELEAELVSEATLKDPNCMNLIKGGQRVWVDYGSSAMVCETISRKLKKIWADPDRRKANCEIVKGWWSDERRKEQSRLKKKQYEDPALRDKIGSSSTKVWKNEKLRQDQSELKIRHWQDPIYRERVLASQAILKKTHAFIEAQRVAKLGPNNPNYGKCWIHNDSIQKSTRIVKGDPIPLGWELGRRMYNKP